MNFRIATMVFALALTAVACKKDEEVPPAPEAPAAMEAPAEGAAPAEAPAAPEGH